MPKKPQKKGSTRGYHATLEWHVENYVGAMTTRTTDMISFIFGKTFEQVELDFSRCKSQRAKK
jgi:hypothetical protein